jgi:hypothetical protein
MSILNAVKIGIAAVAAVKLATWSYTACRDVGRVQAKLAYLAERGETAERVIFATEAQLDEMMGEAK